MIEAALISILGSDSSILSVIGKKSQIAIAGDGEARSYPKLVLDAYDGRYHLHSRGATAMRGASVKLNAWAKTPQTASSLADAVEDCLNGYTGVAAGVGISAIYFKQRYPRQQEIEGKLAGQKDTLFCQTIQIDINCVKAEE